MRKKEKKFLTKILVSAFLFGLFFLSDLFFKKIFNIEYGLSGIIDTKSGWVLEFILYFSLYIYAGFDILKKTVISIKNKNLFNEKFLMAIASLGAFVLGIHNGIKSNNPDGFSESCAVVILYQLGEWFQLYATNKSRNSISKLMEIRPDYAFVIRDGERIKVDPQNVKVGEIITIGIGERVPLDGVVVNGVSAIDTRALTGESLPKDVCVGDSILSGSINMTSRIDIRVEREYSSSTVSKILELVESATLKKSRQENFISRFAKYYTPLVVFLSLFVATIPPVISYFVLSKNTFSIWIYRSLSFLVMSCPCALVISIPLSFFQSIGKASRCGILVKGSIFLEKLKRANIFVFDKTGTLTKGEFSIDNIYKVREDEDILKLCAIAERESQHPISKAILSAYKKEIDNSYTIVNIEGKGVKAAKGEDVILAGNEKLMNDFGIDIKKSDEENSTIYVARNNEFIGYITIKDTLKAEAKKTISALNSKYKTYMLTGDSEKSAKSVNNSLNFTGYKHSLLPLDKVNEVEKIKKDGVVAYIGEGINDAGVLACADVGISIGNIASESAINASDIVISSDNLEKVIEAKKIATKAVRIASENIAITLSTKALVMLLSAFGITNMWLAVFADVGVCILAILNSFRNNL